MGLKKEKKDDWIEKRVSVEEKYLRSEGLSDGEDSRGNKNKLKIRTECHTLV